ncbi:transposase [Persicobacter diffluens]|uniref:IS4 family transposase n=2 Tax=Persicobacter diffluens TaxID=981 RepID=A0AAN4VZL1_9BACT|nr:IS4 family transposase [Persicobacter diffluens]
MFNSLHSKLTQEFPKWGKACWKNVLALSLGIIRKGTVCLNKVKDCIGSILENQSTSASGHYKRLTRIFTEYSDTHLWSDLLQLSAMHMHKGGDFLMVDGTSWKQGDRTFHFMTLAILYNGVAVPIYFMNLEKKGISNQEERIQLLEEASKLFNLEGKILLADREYAGQKFIKYLEDNGFKYVLRVKECNFKNQWNEKSMTKAQMISKVINSKVKGKTMSAKMKFEAGDNCRMVIKKSEDAEKEPVIFLLTNLSKNAYKVAEDYRKRWQIETCFRHLKTNGFDLEKMNVQGADRCRLMMAIVVFAYSVSIAHGLKKYKSVSLKTYANGKRYRSISVFRKGVECIAEADYRIENWGEYILIHFLSHDRKICPKSINV